jgi:hypothetical protein
LASGVPATVTCTREFANWLGTTLSIEAGPLGDVGDEPSPPQAVTSVANVAQEASWQAPAQNCRLVTGTHVSGITILERGKARVGWAISRPPANEPAFPELAVRGGFAPITNWVED